jgi:hypothetical protein
LYHPGPRTRYSELICAWALIRLEWEAKASQVVDFQGFRTILLTADEPEGPPGGPGPKDGDQDNSPPQLTKSKTLRNAQQALRAASSYKFTTQISEGALLDGRSSYPLASFGGAPEPSGVPGRPQAPRNALSIQPLTPVPAEPAGRDGQLSPVLPTEIARPSQGAVLLGGGTDTAVPAGRDGAPTGAIGQGTTKETRAGADEPSPSKTATVATGYQESPGTGAELASEGTASSVGLGKVDTTMALGESRTPEGNLGWQETGVGPPGRPRPAEGQVGADPGAPPNGGREPQQPSAPNQTGENGQTMSGDGGELPHLFLPFEDPRPILEPGPQRPKVSSTNSAKALKLAVDGLWQNTISPINTAPAQGLRSADSLHSLPSRGYGTRLCMETFERD